MLRVLELRVLELLVWLLSLPIPLGQECSPQGQARSENSQRPSATRLDRRQDEREGRQGKITSFPTCPHRSTGSSDAIRGKHRQYNDTVKSQACFHNQRWVMRRF